MDEETIESFFRGVIETEERAGFLLLHRFGKELREYYKSRGEWFDTMSNCQAGVVLCAKDCKSISFRCKVFYSYYESGADFDLLREDGSHEIINVKPGEGEIKIRGNGEKLRLYFPYAAICGIKDFSIEAKPEEKPQNKIFCFGDSITQGYLGGFSGKIYPAYLSQNADAEVFNFGVGGYYFDEKVTMDLERLPKAKLATVAYGTNDWSGEKDYADEARGLIGELSKRVERVSVILPITRKNAPEVKKYGTLFDVRRKIAQICEEFENVKVTDCGERLSADLMLSEDGIHPNSLGAETLAKEVFAAIKEHWECIR